MNSWTRLTTKQRPAVGRLCEERRERRARLFQPESRVQVFADLRLGEAVELDDVADTPRFEVHQRFVEADPPQRLPRLDTWRR